MYRDGIYGHLISWGCMGSAIFCFSSSISMGNPGGGVVVGGQAAISQAGTTLQVVQTSDRAVINWRDFSIQPNETTRFIQPSASSAVLNRVTSSSPSQLLGSLQANGQVYLMNQNGIFVGQGAVINASSFLATTAEANPSSFMRGEALSMVAASDAGIRNEGTIRANGGSIHLLSKHVENIGKLEAPQGTVGLYAGSRFYLEQDTGGPIRVRIDMDPSTSGSRAGIGVDQQGIIRAARVNLEANGNIYALAIQQSGLVEATGFITRQDGTVVLSAPGGKILQSGTMLAKNSDGSGGQMELRGAEVELDLGSILTASGSGVGSGGGAITIDSEGTSLVRGQLDVSSVSGQGGRLVVTGQRVGFLEGKMSASGGAGGGEVLLGGDYQGKNAEVKNAQVTVMGMDAEIVADAMVNGDGGKIILWSDEYTGFYGELFARGGTEGGNGGLVETSSKNNLQAMGLVNASALKGNSGLWLLDPRNVTIASATTGGSFTGGVFVPTADSATVSATTIVSTLDGGTDVQITTGSTGSQAGNITVTDAVVTASSANTSLTLSAANNIIVNNNIDLSSSSGAANILLLADADASGAGSLTTSAVITAGATGAVTLQSAGVISLGALVTAQDAVFKASTVLGSIAVNDSTGSVAISLADLTTNLAVTGTVTIGRADGAGPIRVGALDLSLEAYSLQFLSGNLGQVRLNGNIVTAGKAVGFTSAVILTGDRLVDTTNGGVTATGANIIFSKALDGDGLANSDGTFWDMSTRAGTGGDITFTQAVGAGARLGNIVITSSRNLTTSASVIAESMVSTSSVGTITVSGPMSLSEHGISAATPLLNLATTADMNLGGGADILSEGSVTLQAGTGIFSGGDILTTDQNVTFSSALTLTGPVSINVGSGGNPVLTFASTVDGAYDLTLAAGLSGNIVLSGPVGQSTRLGSVQIISANNVSVPTISSESFLQSAGAGTTTFNGSQNYNTVAGLNVTTGNIGLAAASVTTTAGGVVSLAALTNLDVGAAGDIVADGAVSLTAGSRISTAGDITTTGDVITFASPTVLAGSISLDTTSGAALGANILLNGTIDGPFSLTLNAGTAGVATLAGIMGGTQALSDLDITAFQILLNAASYRVDETGGGPQIVNLTGATILGSNVAIDTDGTLADNSIIFSSTVNSDSTSRALTITAGLGDLSFGGAVGATQLSSLTVNSSGILTTGSTVSVAGAGAILLTADDLVLAGAVATTSGAITVRTTTLARGISINDPVSGAVLEVSALELARLSTTGLVTFGQSDGTGTINLAGSGTTTFAYNVSFVTDKTDPAPTGHTNLNGSVLTASKTITIDSPVLLGNSPTVDSSNSGLSTGANIAFGSTIDADNSASNNRTLTLNAGSGVVSLGGSIGATSALADFDVSGSSISMAGSILKVDDGVGGATVSFSAPTTISANLAIDTDGVADNSVSFSSTLNSDATATPRGLTAATGSGNFTAGALGTAVRMGIVSLSGAQITLGTVTGASLGVAATGVVIVGGANTFPAVPGAGGAVSISSTGDSATVSGAIDTRGDSTGLVGQAGGSVTISAFGTVSVAGINTSGGAAQVSGVGGAAGTVTIDSTSGAQITLNGSITAVGGSAIGLSTGGNGSAVVFNDPVFLGGTSVISTAGGTGTVSGTAGNITFSSTLRGAQALTLAAGTGDILFSSEVGGGGSALGGLSVTTSGLLSTAAAVSVGGAGAITLTVDNIVIGAAMSSGSGAITIQPNTLGRTMSISDPSLVGLQISSTEAGFLSTTGFVTFGRADGSGAIQLAGTAATTFGYDVSFQTSGVINLNGNLNAGSNTVISGSSLALSTPATLTAGIIQISGTSITGSAFTFNAPEIDMTAPIGTDVTISSNLIFAQNASLSGVGRNLNFTGTLNSFGGQRNLVITAGTTGGITFAQSLGGAVSFGNILVQGQDVGLGAGASIRGRSVTVDAGNFLNLAGGSALVSTAGRTLVFSANPNGNSPTTFNGGISGLVPVFNQAPQIQITGAGAFTVGNSLPGGSLAVYQAQLADVLPVSDLFQITDQQAFLAAVPITGITLPRLFVGEVTINRSQEGGVPELKSMNSQKYNSDSGLGIKAKEGKPVTRLPKSLETRRGEATSPREVSQKIGSGKGELSYSQYSQGFDSLGQ